jgi:adenosylhomocysteine nucleosidase
MQLKNPRGRVKRGVIGSAFQYNREIDMLKALRGVFGTDTEDMESAYAAGAALALSTPLVAIRMISDSEFHHPTFERIAGQYCAEFVLQLVRQLPPR